MSKINLENLSESRELDRAASAELRGGIDLPNLPLFAQTVLADIDVTSIELAGVSTALVADHGSINSIGGSFTLTNVIGSSSLTVLQGV